jgi:hypothetical protein
MVYEDMDQIFGYIQRVLAQRQRRLNMAGLFIESYGTCAMKIMTRNISGITASRDRTNPKPRYQTDAHLLMATHIQGAPTERLQSRSV